MAERTNFDSDDHALVTGLVTGVLMRASDIHGLRVARWAEPVRDEAGNYTRDIDVWLDLPYRTGTPIMVRLTVTYPSPTEGQTGERGDSGT